MADAIDDGLIKALEEVKERCFKAGGEANWAHDILSIVVPVLEGPTISRHKAPLSVAGDDVIVAVRDAIWREDHYDPKLCSHSGDGGRSCAYCEPHDDPTPEDWPADKERAERQARAAIAAMQQPVCADVEEQASKILDEHCEYAGGTSLGQRWISTEAAHRAICAALLVSDRSGVERLRAKLEVADLDLRCLVKQRDRVSARCRKLETALKPFAEAARDCLDDEDDRATMWEHPAAMDITAADLRKARAALDTPTSDKGEGNDRS